MEEEEIREWEWGMSFQESEGWVQGLRREGAVETIKSGENMPHRKELHTSSE